MFSHLRLNSRRMGCKPLSLHQLIKTCHIKLLLKLIVKSIHTNTPNNISTNKKTKPIHVSLKSQSLFTSCISSQSLPDQLLPPHYLTGLLSAAALPCRNQVICSCSQNFLGSAKSQSLFRDNFLFIFFIFYFLFFYFLFFIFWVLPLLRL